MRRFRQFSSPVHLHTDRSLDGGSPPKSMIKQAKKMGMNAFAVTDHGTMAAIFDCYDLCKKEGLIFIPGIEAYIKDPWSPPKVNKKTGEEFPGYCHLTIHFKDVEAYEYFCNLSYCAAARGPLVYGELKPLIEWDELRAIAGHIVVTTGCFDGPIQKQVRLGNLEAAEQAYLALKEMVGPENFFVELMCHILDSTWVKPVFSGRSIEVPGYFTPNEIDPETGEPNDIQRKPNLFARQLAAKYGDRLIAGSDAHLATGEDKPVQDVRLGHSWRFSTAFKIMDSDEVFDTLQKQLGADCWTVDDHNQMITNGYEHSEMFKGFKMRSPDTDGWMLPNVQTVYGDNCTKTSKELLLEVIKKKGRLPTDERRPAYLERLKKEIDVFTNHGIDAIPYILTAYEIAEYGNQNNNFISLRGSSGGSLVYYLVGLSTTDPIKHGLLFERHLTPDRIAESPPDADLDIAFRDKALDYIHTKYGDKAALISTLGLMRLKSSVKHLEDMKFGKCRPETHIMCKKLPSAPQGMNDVDFLYGYTSKEGEHVLGLLEQDNEPGVAELKQYIKDNPDIWEIAQKCMGVVFARGVHAGGVVIASEPIHSFLPMYHSKDREFVTDYTMGAVEKQRGIKFDILGLKALEVCGEVLKLIKERHGVEIEWNEFPHDDRVYTEVIQKDKVSGIFQLCSEKALRPWVTKFKIKNIGDISNLVALIRPGALDAPSVVPGVTNAEYFVGVENGEYQPQYVHPDLEPILKSTNSVCVYQEQIMKIFEQIGDLSPVESVWAMRAISKKDRAKLEMYNQKLKEACITKGWTDEQISLLINQIAASARYCFNKSHSTAYSIIPYNQCYLKYHYPLEFWCGFLTANANKFDKIREVLPECRHLISLPNIRYSKGDVWTIANEKVVAPLISYKGIGVETANAVTEWYKQNEPKTWDDVCESVRKTSETKSPVDAGTLLMLLYGGAFDELIPDTEPSTLHACADQLRAAMKSKATGGTTGGAFSKPMSELQTPVDLQLFRYEHNPVHQICFAELFKEKLAYYGFTPTRHWNRTHTSELIDVFADFSEVMRHPALYKFYEPWESPKQMALCGVVLDAVSKPTAQGKPSYVITFFDGNGTHSFRLWSGRNGTINAVKLALLKSGRPVMLTVRPNIWNGFKGGSIQVIMELC
jgi:DNA polymerase-3 subunit alpha